MYYNFQTRSDTDAPGISKCTLKNLVIIIALVKFGSIAFYTGLFFGAHWYASGGWAFFFKTCAILPIPIQLLNGMLLYWGAVHEHKKCLYFGMWMTLALAPFNAVFGVLGLFYFIKANTHALYFILSLFYSMLAFSVFSTVYKDTVIIYALLTYMRNGEAERPKDYHVYC